MSNAVKVLENHLSEMGEVDLAQLDVPERAQHIGAMNDIASAIQLLELCQSHGILSGSIIKQLPDAEGPHFQYVIAHMNESTDPSSWEEVLFEGNQFWLDGGDLVIKR